MTEKQKRIRELDAEFEKWKTRAKSHAAPDIEYVYNMLNDVMRELRPWVVKERKLRQEFTNIISTGVDALAIHN